MEYKLTKLEYGGDNAHVPVIDRLRTIRSRMSKLLQALSDLKTAVLPPPEERALVFPIFCMYVIYI